MGPCQRGEREGHGELTVEDQVYLLHGVWKILLSGEIFPAEWNSRGAAEAGLVVERRRAESRRSSEHNNKAASA